MNFIFDGFLCGVLMVSISFKHLLVICEEILLNPHVVKVILHTLMVKGGG